MRCDLKQRLEYDIVGLLPSRTIVAKNIPKQQFNDYISCYQSFQCHQSR
jgi:hypothetical protein